MPFLAGAIDPLLMQQHLAKFCPDLAQSLSLIEIRAIRVVRYKPERRCLIEYQLTASELPPKSLTILGKVRAKGLDRKTFELQKLLWRGDFGPENHDGIQVPEPLGTIPPFQMWLQSTVPGTTATALLAKPEGVSLARRIAEAIHKLHRAKLPAPRSH